MSGGGADGRGSGRGRGRAELVGAVEKALQEEGPLFDQLLAGPSPDGFFETLTTTISQAAAPL
jgi:hypothetical protein